MIHGSCLCGEVRFEVELGESELRLCHCSLCRKASGSAYAALLNVPYHRFRWLGGEELIRRYQRLSGYGCVFCGTCGSPLPDSDGRKTMFDVPAGLLDEHPGLAVAKHIYVGSKAGWDVIGDDAPRHEEMPPRA
jgi:hypothetical protein